MLRFVVVTTMDDDLWGPPYVVQDGTLCNQTLRGCEFWFDYRTDVLYENAMNESYCEQVLRILNEKKHDAENVDRERDMGSSYTGYTPDSEKRLSLILPDADTGSAKSDLDEDEYASSISDAQSISTQDSSKDTEDNNQETRLKPQETSANDSLTVEPVGDDASSAPLLATKSEEAEENSCSSLVTDQVLDHSKQAAKNISSSPMSREICGVSTLRLSKTRQKVREKAYTPIEDGGILKDHHKSDGLQDIITASEPFTMESLLEMCDEQDKDRESPCNDRIKSSQPEACPEAGKTTIKDELIIKAKSDESWNPGSVLIKKRQMIRSNSAEAMNKSFIRNTKQKIPPNKQGEAVETRIDPDDGQGQTKMKNKNSTQTTTPEIRASSLPTQLVVSPWDTNSVLSTCELKNKTAKELKIIARSLKLTHYYKLKKDDLLQRLTSQLNPS